MFAVLIFFIICANLLILAVGVAVCLLIYTIIARKRPTLFQSVGTYILTFAAAFPIELLTHPSYGSESETRTMLFLAAMLVTGIGAAFILASFEKHPLVQRRKDIKILLLSSFILLVVISIRTYFNALT